jgi:hypothetical protein
MIALVLVLAIGKEMVGQVLQITLKLMPEMVIVQIRAVINTNLLLEELAGTIARSVQLNEVI